MPRKEQDNAFEEELIALRRMTRKRPAIRKDHALRYVRDPAAEFSINEVPEPANAEAGRRSRGNEVRDLPRVRFGLFAIPYPRDHAPDKPAVEGHPSVPDGEDLKRMDEIGRQVIEEHVAQPHTDHEAEHDKGIEGLEEVTAEREATFFYMSTAFSLLHRDPFS